MFFSIMDRKADDNGRMFLAALPDPATAARIFRLGGVLKRAHSLAGKMIAPERLHVSLFFLGEPSEDMVRIACESAAQVRARPFEVRFDRSASFQGGPGGRPFVLVGDDGLDALRSLRRALGAALARKGLKRLSKRDFTPHVTLFYSERRVEEHPIEPIGWTVSEFVLIRSMRGHSHLARWPLRC